MSPEKIAEHEPTAVKRNTNEQKLSKEVRPVLILLEHEKGLEKVE
jgi:hypothetical protein